MGVGALGEGFGAPESWSLSRAFLAGLQGCLLGRRSKPGHQLAVGRTQGGGREGSSEHIRSFLRATVRVPGLSQMRGRRGGGSYLSS